MSGDREGHALVGPTVPYRLAFLNSDAQAFYTACQVQNRLPPLKMDNIKDGDWYVPKNNKAKAVSTMAFVK
jgi:expansin (peptidoglycan-binding protein)